MNFKKLVILSVLAGFVVATKINIEEEHLKDLIKNATPVCGCSPNRLREEDKPACKIEAMYRNGTADVVALIDEICKSLKVIIDEFHEQTKPELSSKITTTTSTSDGPSSTNGSTSTGDAGTTNAITHGSTESTSDKTSPTTVSTSTGNTGTTNAITHGSTESTSNKTSSTTVSTTTGNTDNTKATPTASTTANPTTFYTDVKTGSTPTTTVSTATVNTDNTDSITAANNVQSVTDSLEHKKRDDELYTLGTVLGVMFGAFVLGVLIAIAAKMAYGRYGKRSYRIPPEQRRSNQLQMQDSA